MRIKIILMAVLLALFSGCAKKAEKMPQENVSEDTSVIHIDPIEEAEEKNEGKEEVEEPVEKPAEEPVKEPVAKKYLIAIDPGHQSWDVDMSDTEPNGPGSDIMKQKATSGTSGTYSGIPEYALNMDISLMLRDELQNRGYEVLLTRENNDTAISNAERAQMANEAGADIYLRIHANGSESSSAQGALALIPSAQNQYTGELYEPSRSLAESVLEAYCDSTGFENQGLQENDTMTGINWSEVPVMILEMGFMTNEHDDLKMADSDFRKTMVTGIADGVDQYFEDMAPTVQDETSADVAVEGPPATAQEQPATAQELDAALREIISEQDGELWSVYVQKEGDTSPYISINERAQQSASLIKLFIAAAAEQDRESLEEQEQYSGETSELITKMLSASDNEAANTLTRRLGNGDASEGISKVNAFCQNNSYSDTSMGRLMLDFEAETDNYTSARDCCVFLRKVLQGGVVGADEILSALKKQERTGKLPAGIPEGVATANKTGELNDVENDAAIVWAGSGTYIICVLSEELTDTYGAQERISRISGTVYSAIS